MKTKERNSSPTRAHHVALGQVNKSGLEMCLVRCSTWKPLDWYFAISHPNATLVSQIWNIFNGF